MKALNKFLSLILFCAMVMSLCIPAFASERMSSEELDTPFIMDIDNGKLFSAESDDKIVAILTNDDLHLDYSRLMQQQITKIVQDEWAAEDLMQTTLVKLIDKVQDLRTKDRNHLINYIISACKNQARNYMRDKNRHAEYSIDEYLDMPNPHDGADEIEMRLAYTDELEHLSKVWPKLDGRSRYLLESHYILEKSPYEIAANLGIKPDSVRMALTRARKAAYALLAKE